MLLPNYKPSKAQNINQITKTPDLSHDIKEEMIFLVQKGLEDKHSPLCYLVLA